MRVLRWVVLASLAVALLAITWQHVRYLEIRRDIVADRQPVFHSSSTFHVATVLALDSRQSLLPSVREIVSVIEQDGASVVYAGKIAANALRSSQIPRAEWDAFVLAQYPSQAAYEISSKNPVYIAARGKFANSYSLGMRRSPWTNLAMPIALLGTRIGDIVTATPARYPFRRAEASNQLLQRRQAKLLQGLLADREYGRKACVVVNFIKNGDAAQQEANSAYGSEMLGLMAETVSGPMHIGEAVTVEGNADFDQIVIVYYPGVEYFADMVESEFYSNISGGKQLQDTLSSPTVPLLQHF